MTFVKTYVALDDPSRNGNQPRVMVMCLKYLL